MYVYDVREVNVVCAGIVVRTSPCMARASFIPPIPVDLLLRA